jgi:hypothetical protein
VTFSGIDVSGLVAAAEQHHAHPCSLFDQARHPDLNFASRLKSNHHPVSSAVIGFRTFTRANAILKAKDRTIPESPPHGPLKTVG